MYYWYVSFITEEGIQSKNVKANSKQEAIQKASKDLASKGFDYRRIQECKLIRRYSPLMSR